MFLPMEVFDSILPGFAPLIQTISDFRPICSKAVECMQQLESNETTFAAAKELYRLATNNSLYIPLTGRRMFPIFSPDPFQPQVSLSHTIMAQSNTDDFVMIPGARYGLSAEKAMRVLPNIYGEGTAEIMNMLGYSTRDNDIEPLKLQYIDLEEY